jgi:hypothetical protein
MRACVAAARSSGVESLLARILSSSAFALAIASLASVSALRSSSVFKWSTLFRRSSICLSNFSISPHNLSIFCCEFSSFALLIAFATAVEALARAATPPPSSRLRERPRASPRLGVCPRCCLLCSPSHASFVGQRMRGLLSSGCGLNSPPWGRYTPSPALDLPKTI